MIYRYAVEQFSQRGFGRVPLWSTMELEVGLVLNDWRPPSNDLPEVPWHCKLDHRQIQRQRMRHSRRLFISPDFVLTKLLNKDGWFQSSSYAFYRSVKLPTTLNVRGSREP